MKIDLLINIIYESIKKWNDRKIKHYIHFNLKN